MSDVQRNIFMWNLSGKLDPEDPRLFTQLNGSE